MDPRHFDPEDIDTTIAAMAAAQAPDDAASAPKFGGFVTGLVLVGATVGAGLGAVVLGGAPAGAATLITVNDAGDGAPVPANCLLATEGDCTLRAAVEAAVGGDTTITLPDANSVPNSPSSTHTYTLLNANGSLLLNDSGHTVTINGAGQSLAKIDLVGATTLSPNRVLQVSTGTTADISGITAEGGFITAGPGGGGILNDGTLNLSNSTVTGNSAFSGGGVYLDGVSATLTGDTITTNTGGSGGGVTMQDGTNVISGGSVDGNHSVGVIKGAGGGIDIEDLNPGDSASLSNVDVSSNTSSIDGGGLYVGNQSAASNNQVTLTNVTADNNTADDSGGGLYVSNGGAGGGTVTMTGGSVSGNSAASNGGGIYDQNNGHGGSVHFTGVSVNSNTSSINAGGIYVQDDASGDTTTFSGGSIDNNSTNTTATTGQGGGVYLLNNGIPSSASFSAGSISGNRAYEGGGVYLAPGSFPTRTGDSATFTSETVSGNTVTEAGGGFFDDAGAVQPLTIASSTISGNHAGVLATSDGGGIEAFAPPTTCSAIALTNDTITANTAVGGGGYYGAGCMTTPTVTTAFKFDTISGNTATNSAGAGNIQTASGDISKLTLADSIVANGSASGGAHTNCLLAGTGTFTSGGYNLIDNTNCGSPAATDIIGKNPQLGALANNGGPTQTEEPAAASPAVGAIPSAVCSASGVTTDQRGVARGEGANGSCTIGSVEVAGVPTVSAVSPNAGPTSGGTAITITGTGFVTGATVKIGQGSGAGPTAIAATNVKVVSPTEITAVTGGGAKAGTWSLFVVTSGGTGIGYLDFTYNPVPTVSAVSPNAGPTSGGTAITITGTGFVTGATVKIGQGSGAGPTAIAATNVKVVSPTEITAVTGGGAKAGTWSLFVVTSGGTGIGYLDFTYNPVPTVSAVSPNAGPTSGGTAITITGTGFVTGATVKIGQGSGAGPTAIAATNVKVVSPTEITAVTGGGAKAGTWSLFVVTSGGTGIGYLDFTYH